MGMLNCIHNLRMDSSNDYFRKAVVEGSEQMKQEKNIETSALKAELIIQYQERGCSSIPARYSGLKNLFVDLYGTEKWAGLRKTVDADVFFDMVISDYKEWCEGHEQLYGMEWLIDMDNRVSAANMVFVRLVRFFNVMSKHIAELAEWTPKEIAESLLSYMHDYFAMKWTNEFTIEEDMLDCLMFADCECQ